MFIQLIYSPYTQKTPKVITISLIYITRHKQSITLCQVLNFHSVLTSNYPSVLVYILLLAIDTDHAQLPFNTEIYHSPSTFIFTWNKNYLFRPYYIQSIPIPYCIQSPYLQSIILFNHLYWKGYTLQNHEHYCLKTLT